MSNDTQTLLAQRQKTHGEFAESAAIAQSIKATFRATSNWRKLDARQREALELVATKFGRILAGDHECLDHWRDVSGYALLPTHLRDQAPLKKCCTFASDSEDGRRLQQCLLDHDHDGAHEFDLRTL